MGLLNNYQNKWNKSREKYSLEEYLKKCKKDKKYYSSSSERILDAIGDPKILNTKEDDRLSRIFFNKKINKYPAFKDFYGMEETIEKIVSYFKHSAQGLEEKKQVLYLLGPVGGGKCHRKGTKISLYNGSIKNIENIEKGDIVISTDEYGYNLPKKVLNTFKIQPKEIVDITTDRGLNVSGASTHHLLTNEGWKAISELKKGDFIATSRKTKFGEKDYDVNYIKLLSYLLGDGHLPKNGNIIFTNFNEKIIEDFKNCVHNIGCIAKEKYDINNKLDYFRIKEGNKIPFRKWVESIGLRGKKSYNKFIPNFIFELKKELVSAFISRLYSTDGWATIGSRCEIGFCSVSKEMSMQLVSLLSKFGISARVNKKKAKINGKEYRTAYNVMIKDKNDIKIFLSEIGIYGKEDSCNNVLKSIHEQKRITSSLDRIPKNMVINMTENIKASKIDNTSKIKYQLRTELDNNKGSRREFVQSASLLLDCEELQLHSNNDIYWDIVKDINYTGEEEEMYDFEVEGLHNYIANGIISHNSSISEKLKSLIEKNSIYTVSVNGETSPVFESPLGIFYSEEDKEMLEKEYGIPKRYVPSCMSPWLSKRLEEIDYNLSKVEVVEMKPSISNQIAVTKVEPGDENNQDISALVGKVDIRKLAEYSQDDPDAYSYSGGLCRGNRGVLEFVEMFKAPIKTLHPLLTATQEGNFKGTEGLPAIPFQGVVLSHSNESEWEEFCNNKTNEAFLDRVCVVRVPYCLRVNEEIDIYKKLIKNSSLSKASCAPKTLEILAQFSILTRLVEPENSNIFSKLRVYNGEYMKEKDPKAKSLQEYKNMAGLNEGMDGVSTRFAYKVLSKVYNYDSDEIAANPIHLFHVLENEVKNLQLSKEKEERYLDYIESILKPNYISYIGNEIQKAYVESYSEFGQNLFERYIMYADHWSQDTDYRDSDTGSLLNKEDLNKELEKIEKPAGVINPKDFRHEVISFTLRHKANNSGEMPRWDKYEKMKNVIEKRIFSKTEDLLPVISFSPKEKKEDSEKHKNFVKRMKELGYTEKQVQLIVDWYMRSEKNR